MISATTAATTDSLLGKYWYSVPLETSRRSAMAPIDSAA
jgi:hypothetical protein